MQRAVRVGLILAIVLAAGTPVLQAVELCCSSRLAYSRAQMYTWHGNYYHGAYGAPVALVVPPVAGRQTDYHWGVAGYRTSPIYPQFGRGYPGYYVSGSPAYFLPTPRWPSDTNQFGVYYVRGPW